MRFTGKAVLTIVGILIIAVVAATLAMAQSTPNLITGQVPTAAQWNSYFAAKQDTLGYSPVRKSGDVMLGLLRFSMGAPTLSSCGTNPSVSGSNQAGVVTMGTGSPSGCTITFNSSNPWSATPACVVSWQTNLASMVYTVTTSAITLTQTATSSNKVGYICAGLQ